MISRRAKILYDESLNPFAEPRTSVAFSEQLRDKLKQMGFGGDTEKPVGIEFDDIVAASFRIRKGVGKTPCEKCSIPELSTMEVFFKKENLHPSGSFKERGAINSLLLLSEDQKDRGVITATPGNHGIALAFHGQALGIPVHVVLPEQSPLIKQTMCKKFGASIIIKGSNQAEAKEFATSMATEKRLAYIEGHDHPHVISGQGTIGLEIIDQVCNVDAVVLPVGGGGLLAGVALAVKTVYPDVQIIGVESKRCPSFQTAIDAGHPVTLNIDHPSALTDALNLPKVGKNAFHIATGLVDKLVAVSDDHISLAVLKLIENERAVTEGSGAAGVAALLGGYLPELHGKRVVVPLCGGNIDPSVLSSCIEKGLALEGRLVRFTITIDEKSGGLAQIITLLASVSARIRDMTQEQILTDNNMFTLKCNILVEVRDSKHAQSVKTSLESYYKDVLWNATIKETA
ncbi:L-threonine ammonia-lyase-like [Pocillopora verrucosa]|nr:L-threonine ammonia-lyase-like [Pocillopora verrucosa]